MAKSIPAVAALLSVAMPSTAIQIVGFPGNVDQPKEPGCFLRKLKSCPEHPLLSGTDWKRAEQVGEFRDAKVNRNACEVDAKAALEKICGTADVEALFVPAPDLETETLPSEPGCFLRKLKGCPKHPELAGTSWKHAENAENLINARINRTACEVDAKEALAAFCGTAEVEVMFVPPAGLEMEHLPGEPGCFVRKLKGCPNHPAFNGTAWKHAEHAEKFRNAKVNRTECELHGKVAMATYCGTEAVEVLFVPQPERVPHAQPAEQEADQRDPSSGVEEADGGRPSFEEVTTRPQQDQWTDEIWQHSPPVQETNEEGLPIEVNKDEGWPFDEEAEVAESPLGPSPTNDGADGDEAESDGEGLAEAPTEPPSGSELPQEPGCFVRTRVGCPRHPTFASAEWKHERYGERALRARANRTVCEVERKMHVAHWCGTDHVEMAFVPALEPGCFVRTPSGCPKHPSFSSTAWKHESFGEEHLTAKVNRTVCEIFRKVHVVSWCGTPDVQVRFVPPNRASLIVVGEGADSEEEGLRLPLEPGCFIRTPTGCPKHPAFDSTGWKHEAYGEAFTTAGVNSTACEVDRKMHVAHWCGADDVEAFFVPAAEPGCYVRTPSGCPNHPHFSSNSWKHEVYGETHADAKANRTACMVSRRLHLQHWCGADDTETLFIADQSRGRWGSS